MKEYILLEPLEKKKRHKEIIKVFHEKNLWIYTERQILFQGQILQS